MWAGAWAGLDGCAVLSYGRPFNFTQTFESNFRAFTMGAACSAPAPDPPARDRETSTLGPLLSAPLWAEVSGFLDPAERWYLGGVEPFCLAVADPGAGVDDYFAVVKVLKLVVLNDYMHILRYVYPRVAFCADLWSFAEIFNLMARLDRRDMLEFVHARFPKALAAHYRKLHFRSPESAAGGALGVLRWERDRGYGRWTADTALLLAEGGHLRALRQVRSGWNPCPWHEGFMIDYAVKGDNVELVKWLRASANFRQTAVNLNSYHIRSADMLKYCLTEGDFNCDVRELTRHVMLDGSIEMVRCLFEHTAIGSVCTDAEKGLFVRLACVGAEGGTAKLAYLLERGWPPPPLRAMLYPDVNPRVFRWFMDRCGAGARCDAAATAGAAAAVVDGVAVAAAVTAAAEHLR